MHSRRNLYLLICALSLLLLALTLDRIFVEDGSGGWRSAIFNVKTLISLLKELSFAFWIALLVIISIEHESRRADRESAERMRREIADDVFKGVFSRDLSREYVDTTMALHLKPSLVRNYVKLDYTFEEIPEEERPRHGASPEHLLLRSRIEFSLRNVTHLPVSEQFQLMNPAWNGSLRDLSKIVRFAVGDTKRALQDRAQDLTLVEEDHRTFYSTVVDFEPDTEKQFVIEVVLLKERSDSHVWSSFYPTMKGDVSVAALPGLNFDLAMNSPTPAVESYRAENGLFARWEIDGPVLTYDSVVLWWRPSRGEAAAEVS